MTSQLKKAERVEAQAWEKELKDKAKWYRPANNKWTVSKATKSCNASGSQKEEKVDEDGGHCECGRRG